MGNELCCEEVRAHDGFEKKIPKKLISEPFEKSNSYASNRAADLQKSEKINKSSFIEEKSINSKYREDQFSKQQSKYSEKERQSRILKEEPPKEVKAIPKIPELSARVKERLKTNHQFDKKFDFEPQVREYGNDVYVGELDQETNRPNGYGKMYKEDGALYVGQFHNGKAQGSGLYIMKDGSYYYGDFKNNCAHSDQGYFQTLNFEYSGSFRANQFSGKGGEKGDSHSFKGQYFENKKVRGTYKWKTENNEEYIYEGPFNAEAEFHGVGTLIEPKGKFTGDFVKGEKHGQGIYKYTNGLKYDGEYQHGVRSGKGIIYNSNNSIAYDGEFKKGVPNGVGFVLDKEGNRVATKWVDGIDQNVL